MTAEALSGAACPFRIGDRPRFRREVMGEEQLVDSWTRMSASWANAIRSSLTVVSPENTTEPSAVSNRYASAGTARPRRASAGCVPLAMGAHPAKLQPARPLTVLNGLAGAKLVEAADFPNRAAAGVRRARAGRCAVDPV
jgi:hypothetical protein